MNRKFLITGAIFGLLAVIIGAFGAHGLKPLLDEAASDSFETGAKYQMYHALLFLLIGWSLIAEHYAEDDRTLRRGRLRQRALRVFPVIYQGALEGAQII